MNFLIAISDFMPSLGSLILVSILTSGLGIFVISKKISLIGESISHAVIPGLAVAYFLKLHESTIYVFFIAQFFIFIYFLLIHFLDTIYPDKKESLFATLQVGFLSLGAIIFQFSPIPIQLGDIFLGNIFAISLNDLYFQLLITFVLVLVFILNFKKFCLLFFDPQFFEAHYKKAKFTQFIFDFLLSSTLILSIQTLGSLLSLGFLVIPTMISLTFKFSIKVTILAALLLAILSSISGFYFSYEFNFGTGASIISVLFIAFLVVSFIKIFQHKLFNKY